MQVMLVILKKIKTTIQPVFISRKLNEDLKFREVKQAIVKQQCLVYQFQCNLCDAGYVGYTRGHLHERVDGHKQKSSSICKHYLSEHSSDVPPFLSEQFHVLTKGSNKFDCLRPCLHGVGDPGLSGVCFFCFVSSRA